MTKVALKGLLGRKLRATLTAVAIVLGVAMVSGTYVLTDTIKHGFDSIFTAAYSSADAVISGKTAFGGSQVLAPAFSESLLPRVRALPEVQRAVGGVSDDQAHLVGRNGKAFATHGAPNLGFSVDPAHDQGLNPLVLVRGRWPKGPHQIVIDAATATHKHYAVGDQIGLSSRGPTQQFRISGIAELGGVASIGGTRVARSAGQSEASSVTRMPSMSATMIVRVANTVPFCGRSTPNDLKSASSPFASARPRKSPTTDASRPTTSDSARTDTSTCRRDAPIVRSIASSRVRCAIVIESVFTITNAPTKSAISPNASRNFCRTPAN